MKTRIFKIFKAFLLVGAVLLLAACSDITSNDTDSGNVSAGGKTAITFNFSTPSRSALPSVSLGSYKFKVQYKLSSASEYRTSPAFSGSSAVSLQLVPGTYDFIVNAYTVADTSFASPVLSGSVSAQAISSASNTVSVVLKAATGGTGTVEITLKVKTALGTAKICADLLDDIPESASVFDASKALTIDTTMNTGYQTVTYTNAAVPTGVSKYVVFFLYDDSNAYIMPYIDSVYAVSGLKSTDSHTIEYYADPTTPDYAVTFEGEKKSGNTSSYKNGVYTLKIAQATATTDEWKNIVFIRNPNKTAGVAADDLIRTKLTVKSDKAVTNLFFRNLFNGTTYSDINESCSLEANVAKTFDLQGFVPNDYVEADSCFIIDLRGSQANTTLTLSNISIEKEVVEEAKERPATTLDASISALALAAKMECGWNLGNTFDARSDSPTNTYPYNQGLSSEMCWGQPLTTKEIIEAGWKAGYKTIRIPVTWANHIIDNEYKIDPKWMNRIKLIVNWAMDAGYYVILNEHHSVHEKMNNPLQHGEGYIMRSGDAAETKAFLKAIWEQIAANFNAEYDEHLVFETMNEPRNSSHDHQWSLDPSCSECKADAALLNECNKLILDTIRASGGNNANRFVIIPPMADNASLSGEEFFTLPTDTATDKLMVTIHNYPLDSGGMGTGSHHFDDSTKNTITSEMKQMNDRFVSKGIPVVLGEFGAWRKAYVSDYVTTYEDRLNCFSYFASLCGKYSVPFVHWDVGDDMEYGMNTIDRESCTVIEPEYLAAVIKSWQDANKDPDSVIVDEGGGQSGEETGGDKPTELTQDWILYTSAETSGTKFTTEDYATHWTLDSVKDLTGYKYLNIEFSCSALSEGVRLTLQPMSGIYAMGHKQGAIETESSVTTKTTMQTKFGTNFGSYEEWINGTPITRTIEDDYFGSVQIFAQNTANGYAAVDGVEVYITKIYATNTELGSSGGSESGPSEDKVLYVSAEDTGTKFTTEDYATNLSLDSVVDLTGYAYMNVEFYCPGLKEKTELVLQPRSGTSNSGHQQGNITTQAASTAKTTMQTKFGTNFGSYTDYTTTPPTENVKITDNNFGSVMVFVQDTTKWNAVDYGVDVYITKIYATNTKLR